MRKNEPFLIMLCEFLKDWEGYVEAYIQDCKVIENKKKYYNSKKKEYLFLNFSGKHFYI